MTQPEETKELKNGTASCTTYREPSAVEIRHHKLVEDVLKEFDKGERPQKPRPRGFSILRLFGLQVG